MWPDESRITMAASGEVVRSIGGVQGVLHGILVRGNVSVEIHGAVQRAHGAMDGA